MKRKRFFVLSFRGVSFNHGDGIWLAVILLGWLTPREIVAQKWKETATYRQA